MEDQPYSKIVTDETLRETICHGSESYPFGYYHEKIWDFDSHCIDWHWHHEVEFVYLEQGSAIVLIGSERLVLREDMAIFINSKVLHRFEAEEDAVIPNIVFSPSLLAAEDSLVYRKYIQPVLSSVTAYQPLVSRAPWQAAAIDALKTVFSLSGAAAPSELAILEQLLRLWRLIFENTDRTEAVQAAGTSARAQAQLQLMLQLIHSEYATPLSLDRLAQSAAISKSGAINLFGRYLHTSPINYLVRYRLRQAARLLVTTEDSVYTIAQRTGFESSSYFCRKFRALFHVTPNEYRASKQLSPASV